MAIEAAMLGLSAAELEARHDARGGMEDSSVLAGVVPADAGAADNINQQRAQQTRAT